MADIPDTPQGNAPGEIRRAFARIQLLSFLPLFVLVAYWTEVEVVLFVVSFMFPLLLALQELVKPAQTETAEQAATTLPVRRSDPLTGLATRAEALAALDRIITAERSTGRVTAVLLFDLEQLRRVNDRYGMAAGDAVLNAVATRITEQVRSDDLVARMDGDGFAVVLSPVKRADFESALALADRVRQAVAEPISHDRHTIYVTCSAGICLMGRSPENTAASMLQSAEVALEEARHSGEGAVRSFSPQMRRRTCKLTALSAELDAALENGQIRPWFQPQLCTDTGQITGFEALARWEHPDDGVLLPGTFLQAVIDSDRSERLGEVILYHALSAVRAWDKSGLKIPAVSVNFATEELCNPKLCEKIKWEVDRFDLEPSRVSIEVLETVMDGDGEDAITRNIHALAGLGFGIDLDDFGTGHASISNIRRFGVGRIKIDRSFVTGVDKEREQQVMIAAILRMAESLDVEVLAEGVETVQEQAMLAQLGCRFIQGYALARPMPFEDTIAWIHKHNEKLAGTTGLDRTG